ncbi:MAG: hypothetical protein NXY59_03040 [Aigarchaeota archaeon]|nr:hypothetical protein [Candidatus Pelearchaeum maunauluense]
MDSDCQHEFEFLGEQKTDEGTNKYFRCTLCGDVFVFPPNSDIAYKIPGRKD